MLRKLALATAALALTGSATLAADLYIPETPAPIVESAGVGFEGLYAGVQLGGYFADAMDNQFVLGGVIGYNFAADPLLVGIELQANYYAETDTYPESAAELLALGKIGVVATENFAVYATGGVGYVWEENLDYSVLALGVGAEFKLNDDVSLRGDILGLAFDGADEFDGARATIGVLWHF